MEKTANLREERTKGSRGILLAFAVVWVLDGGVGPSPRPLTFNNPILYNYPQSLCMMCPAPPGTAALALRGPACPFDRHQRLRPHHVCFLRYMYNSL